MSLNPHVFAATRILARTLGVMLMEGEIDPNEIVQTMQTVPDADGRVTCTFTTLSGDSYELSCRWIAEESP